MDDADWRRTQIERLREARRSLDGLLGAAGFAPNGTSPLFRIIRTEQAPEIFERLGKAGIWTRRFAFNRSLLRIGLPGDDEAWSRLARVLGVSGF